MSKLWSINKNEKLDFLKSSYKHETKEVIMSNLPGHTWVSICHKARSLGLQRNLDFRCKQLRKNNLSILVDGSLESCYWVGFLLADGYMTNGWLDVHLSAKEIEHLIKFKSYIQSTNAISHRKDGSINLRVYNQSAISSIRDAFDFKLRKTYHPPSKSFYSSLSREQILSVFLGFLDGDGTIGYRGPTLQARIRCHYSWKPWITFISNRLSYDYNLKGFKLSEISTPYDNQVFFGIHDREFLKMVLSFAESKGLPYLTRKIGKIKI